MRIPAAPTQTFTLLALTLWSTMGRADPLPPLPVWDASDYNCAVKPLVSPASAQRLSAELNGRVAPQTPRKGTACYEGDVQQGKANGRGRLIFQGEDIYEGGWQQGQRQGWMTRSGLAGDTSREEYHKGEVLGWTHHQRRDGSAQVGLYDNKAFRGLFLHRRADDSMKVEQRLGTSAAARGADVNTQRLLSWTERQYERVSAVLIQASGHRTAGDWRDGGFNGLGEIREPSGQLYQGQLRNGQAHGLGRLLQDGRALNEGRWESGNFQQALPLETSLIERLLRAIDKALAGHRELQSALQQLRPLAQEKGDHLADEWLAELDRRWTAFDRGQPPTAIAPPASPLAGSSTTPPQRTLPPTEAAPQRQASANLAPAPVPLANAVSSAPAAAASSAATASPCDRLAATAAQRTRMFDTLFKANTEFRFDPGTRDLPFLGCVVHRRNSGPAHVDIPGHEPNARGFTFGFLAHLNTDSEVLQVVSVYANLVQPRSARIRFEVQGPEGSTNEAPALSSKVGLLALTQKGYWVVALTD